jgi:hypothetical protein
LSEELLDQLIFGWGNESWSADKTYLREVVEIAARTNGPTLECGSGLTTVLAGIVAANRGTRLCSLEHHGVWAKKSAAALRRWVGDVAAISQS